MATPLVTRRLGEVGSTQLEARQVADASGEVPLLVVADKQTEGRGRAGHGWLTAPRALAGSLAAAPVWERERWGTIPLVAGLAARRALRRHAGIEPGLKWPNDLVTSSGKVGGLLVEASEDLAVIGLGVNLWWPRPPAGAAAIFDEDPGTELAAEIAASWAERVLTILAMSPSSWGHDEYRAACVTVGSEVTWEPQGHGEAIDVAADGALVVQTAVGPRALHSGEVHSVRATTLARAEGDTMEGPTG